MFDCTKQPIQFNLDLFILLSTTLNAWTRERTLRTNQHIVTHEWTAGTLLELSRYCAKFSLLTQFFCHYFIWLFLTYGKSCKLHKCTAQFIKKNSKRQNNRNKIIHLHYAHNFGLRKIDTLWMYGTKYMKSSRSSEINQEECLH